MPLFQSPPDFRAPGTVKWSQWTIYGAVAGTQRIDATGNLAASAHST